MFIPVLAAWLSLLAVSPSRAAECDPRIVEKQVTGKLGYRARADERCEGFYVQPQTGIQLALVSFGRLPASQPIRARDSLLFEIPLDSLPAARHDSLLRIQVNSLRPQVSFRMDAQFAAPRPRISAWSYTWPLDVLGSGAPGSAKFADVGVVGRFRDARGTLYLPVVGRIPTAPRSAGAPMSLVVQSPLQIETLSARFYATGEKPPAFKSVLFGVSPFHPATIPLPKGVAGIVECDVRALFVNGKTQTIHARLQLP